ncbi:NADH-dependent butanol dehydrogenase B [Marinomonas sp. MED121]|uniref:iron-containing alcohol dehydrogenase n=1 Tax=Marinomonas sp. MED121 TaxID=314277 RepID=UPI000068FAC9|nr:iron-containing alcohol dehydrogenase [Marinomonas sp. MED121]EAQ63942.1 NADH-dependent butanol dehydrogenase B [Marinomonas sp. MED121]
MEFSYVNQTQIHFGKGQIASIKNSIPKDQKVLMLYGGGSIKKNSVYDQVVQALAEHDWLEFSGIEPNPTMETLDKAVALAKQEGVQYILAVGGGSVIDGSKYVAAASLYQGEGWDILQGKYQAKTALPIGAILTLPATGSESNPAAVITKAATQEKLSFYNPIVRPVFAVLDADVMKTLPERQLINGLLDAWVHVCEQYLTYPTGAMVQDGYAETLLKNLLALAAGFENRDTDNWRENLMWTANQALNGLIGAGVPQDWATHMIGHELTALYGVDHARSLTLIQPALLRNQLTAKRAKLEQMGQQVFGLAASDDLAVKTIDAIENFYLSLKADTRFSPEGEDKTSSIERLMKQVEAHGLLAIGENQAITLKEIREILNSVIK